MGSYNSFFFVSVWEKWIIEIENHLAYGFQNDAPLIQGFKDDRDAKTPTKDPTAYRRRELKILKKHAFHFLQAKKPQKTLISFFASLKNLKKHEFHFLQA